MSRLSVRDYKRPRRDGLDLDRTRLRDFGAGLAIGLLIAALVFLADHRASSSVRDPPRSTSYAADGQTARGQTADRQRNAHPPGTAASDAGDVNEANGAAPVGAATTASATGRIGATGAGAAGVGKFDFYQMLPRFEVVVPEHEYGSRPPPTAQIDRPGTYFLQVGSYRDPAVAERVRAQVERFGVGASVQRIAVDKDVWRRVRIGPLRDLTLLNRLRRQLQSSNLDSLVIRIEN